MSLLRRIFWPDIPEDIGRPDEPPVERVEPLEGTRVSLWNDYGPVQQFWRQLDGTAPLGNADLASRVWVASRCQQMNAQQIASMPLKWHGSDGVDEPTWASNPDPNMFPNGIGDALHAIVDQVYGWGYSVQYVTDLKADGYPRTWTVLPSANVWIGWNKGSREYKIGGVEGQRLDPRRVVQIDRNPGLGLHGSSALRAYAQSAYGLLAASNQAQSVAGGAVPPGIVKYHKKINKEQAADIQEAWMNPAIPGAPRVLGDDFDWIQNSFNPADMALLENQEWNARTIATAYGVPSVLLNMALQGGLTYQNPGALGEMWWRFELRTTATRIANAFSAQMLPRGQWVSFDAADTFLPLDAMSDDDDEQESQVAKASPAQQTASAASSTAPTGRLTAIGGNR
jgi:hypothetical protein